MTQSISREWKLSVHGAAVEVGCDLSFLHTPIDHLVDAFAESEWPAGFTPASGAVRRYEQTEVLRHLSPTARRVSRPNDLVEIYAEDERFWLIDERWGMTEFNAMRGQWRSWVVPQPTLDPMSCAEMAVLWPMAQVLRSRGVCLVPAVSVVRDGWAALVISPFGVGAELVSLIRDGYRVIGQRWTALREEEGRLALLHMPGVIQRDASSPAAAAAPVGGEGYVDLRHEHRRAWQNHAFCDAVVIVEPGRRARPNLRCVDEGDAQQVIRQAWPITELHPQRRWGQFPAKLAASCRVAEVQLSRDPKDLPALLRTLRESPTNEPGANPDLSISAWVNQPARQTGVAV